MANLRPLAPSTSQWDSTASPASKHSWSGGDGDSGGGGAGGGDGDDSWHKKRRALGTVSANACNACRQARQKCDGVKPNPCSRCHQRGQICQYEPNTKVHKDELLRELERSRAHNTELETTNNEGREQTSRLQDQNRDLQQSAVWQRIILDTIGSNGHDREIIKKLRAGETHQAIADWLRRINPEFESLGLEASTNRNLTEVVKVFEDSCHKDGLSRTGRPFTSQIPWTKVTGDTRLLGHLFDLYFTWVHPVHMIFSELDFKQDFRNSTHTYCSSSLVNAICAMACHLLETESQRGTQLIDVGRGHNAATLCEGFFGEAKREIRSDLLPYMTATQAFAVMYLVELSSGKARSATGYLRSAIEGLRSIQQSQQSQEAKEMTFWGIKVLTTFCIGTTYQKFYSPQVASDPPLFKNVQMDRDHGVWRFYRQVEDDREMPTRPSYAVETAYYQADLFRIVDDNIQSYCGRRGPVTATVANEIYKRYRSWLDRLPPIFKRMDEVEKSLPHFFDLHIQYHTAVLQHLNPLVESGHFTGVDLVEMRRLASWHAMSGIEILVASRKIYSSRFALPIISFCAVHLCDGFMKHSRDSPLAPEAIKHILLILQQTRAGFSLCGPLQELLRQRAEEFGVRLPAGIEELVDSFNHYGIDDILDACTCLSYAQPFDQILDHIDQNVAIEWRDAWIKANSQESSTQIPSSEQPPATPKPPDGKMNIDAVLND